MNRPLQQTAPPTELYILSNPDGHVIGSAYPEALQDLTEGLKPGQVVDRVSRAEHTRRAMPCLLGKCAHGGAR